MLAIRDTSWSTDAKPIIPLGRDATRVYFELIASKTNGYFPDFMFYGGRFLSVYRSGPYKFGDVCYANGTLKGVSLIYNRDNTAFRLALSHMPSGQIPMWKNDYADFYSLEIVQGVVGSQGVGRPFRFKWDYHHDNLYPCERLLGADIYCLFATRENDIGYISAISTQYRNQVDYPNFEWRSPYELYGNKDKDACCFKVPGSEFAYYDDAFALYVACFRYRQAYDIPTNGSVWIDYALELNKNIPSSTTISFLDTMYVLHRPTAK